MWVVKVKQADSEGMAGLLEASGSYYTSRTLGFGFIG